MSTISVIVPIYNVQPYLEECLGSIAQQTHRDLEVICVNDGSTDGSGRIADCVAASDERFKVVHQENAGLGAARNTGIRHATGEYLAFVDSDDYLPPDALELLLRPLRRTGSDFSTGDVRRATPLGLKRSPMHRDVFRKDRPATHVTQFDRLLVDRLACNKLFRRQFWLDAGLSFPEGVLYEDTPTILPAHFLAKSVDVVAAPVYIWRERVAREDRSITQRRLEIQNMRDRVWAVTRVSEFLAGGPWDDSKREYDRLAFTGDLRIFTRLLGEADEDFQREFLEHAQRFVLQAHPRALVGVSAIERLKWFLIERGSLEDLLVVVDFEQRFPHGAPAVTRFGKVYAKLPFYGDRRRRIPRRVFRYDDELALVTRVTGAEVGEVALEVSGWAYIRHLTCPSSDSQKVRVWLRNVRTGATVEGSVRQGEAVQATVEARPNFYDYGGSGFRARFPLSALLESWPSGTDRWQVLIEVNRGRIRREGPVARPTSGSAQRPAFRDIGRARVSPRYERDGGLTFVVRGRPATAVAAASRDGQLRVQLHSPRRPVRLELREPQVGPFTCEVVPTSDDAYTGSVDLRGLLDLVAAGHAPGDTLPKRVWSLHAVFEGGRESRVLAAAELDQCSAAVSGAVFSLDVTRYGNVSVSVRRGPTLWVDQVELVGEGLDVLGSLVGDDVNDVLHAGLSRSDRREYRPVDVDVEVEEGVARVRIHLPFRTRSLAGDLPWPAGRWSLLVSRAVADEEPQPLDIRPRATLSRRLPIGVDDGSKRLEFEDASWGRLFFRVWPDTEVHERGDYHQEQLALAARRRARGRRQMVLFDSYSGRQYSDSPRAMFEELQRRDVDFDVAWVVHDGQVSVPAGARAVPLFRRSWHEALTDAAAIVTNAHLPRHYRRAEGQVCIQTWHGTPLKRIGLDIPDIRWGNPAYKERIVLESQQWTHLVSPNSFSTPILRRAFAYEGPLLEIGYPRNDALLDPQLAAPRESDARRALGLAEGQGPLLLFAPTWRDDDFHGAGRFRLDLRVELARLRAAAGPEAVILVRRHPNVVDAVDVRSVGGGIIDVSEYPDLVDLYLISDALITDYSSSMFDFALTRKPMLFYVYDFELARGDHR
jgi:CDP-glycerol glycerophosphotransferase